jgi:RNA ligase
MKYRYWDVLPKYLEAGWIKKTDHPRLPISIYGYTRTCQFESQWDDVTTDCRGIILDDQGNLIARGFPKFFNWEETDLTIPEHEHVHLQKKEDGSLGILFHYADQWILATRGSFVSDQAFKGMEIIKNKYDLGKFPKEYTYVGEIIYPENRIVVSYGEKESFMFLSIFLGNDELNWNTSLVVFSSIGIPIDEIVHTTTLYDPTDINRSLFRMEDERENEEGYVFRFYPSNYRVKLKFQEYVRLHRLLTSFSNIDIWRLLQEGKPFDAFLERVPDEFDLWVRKNIASLESGYSEIESECRAIFQEKNQEDKKQFALSITDLEAYKKSILFEMFDSKDYSRKIWRKIRPSYQRPFWNDED